MLHNRTSADVVAMMTIEEIAPAGFQLDQFSVDAGLSTEAVSEVQADPTIDGKMTVAYTPQLQTVTITLMPTSPSLPYLRELQRAQRTNRRPYEVNLTIMLPATGERYRYVEGAMTSSQSMPGVNRTLDPIPFTFTFAKVE